MSAVIEELQLRLREQRAEIEQLRAAKDEALNAAVSAATECGKLRSEVERLRTVINGALIAIDTPGGHCLWPELIAAADAAEKV